MFFKLRFLGATILQSSPPLPFSPWMSQYFRAQVSFKPIGIQYYGEQRSNCPHTLYPSTHTQILLRELTEEIFQLTYYQKEIDLVNVTRKTGHIMFLFELVGGKKYYDVTVELCKLKVSCGGTKILL